MLEQYQPYDSALKSLFGKEAAEILPNLLPGSEFISEQNIEIDRTTLKPDLVYNIQYRGRAHILNMELQTGADGDMALRLLKYHVGLYDKHRLPVISMVMYPFETNIPMSPFQERRSKSLSEQQKQKVEEHLRIYDSLLDQDPYFQEEKALERKLGITLGLNEGIQAFQKTIVEIVKSRFPALTELVQQRIVQVQKLDDLQQMVIQLSCASNETAARRILKDVLMD